MSFKCPLGFEELPEDGCKQSIGEDQQLYLESFTGKGKKTQRVCNNAGAVCAGTCKAKALEVLGSGVIPTSKSPRFYDGYTCPLAH